MWAGTPTYADGSTHPEAGTFCLKNSWGEFTLFFRRTRLFPSQWTLFRGSAINAFAGLGGHIYVYDGLLRQADSPDELAGVIAHEIEHVHHRHILQGVLVRLLTTEAMRWIFFDGKQMGPEIARLLLNMSFSRGQEFEADDAGLQRLRQARVDVAGLGRFFERMKNYVRHVPSFLSDPSVQAQRTR